MPNNPDEQLTPGPLQYVPPPSLERIASSLAGIDVALQAMGERERWRIVRDRETAEARRAEAVRRMQPRTVSPTWPWTPATTTQGFLANRWLRRDGTVYAYTPPVPPQVLSGNFRITVPARAGDVVGTCGFIGQATSWAIVDGNAEGFWAINSRGIITVATPGMFEGVIYEIAVTASNYAAVSQPAEMFILTVAGLRRDEPQSTMSQIPGGDDSGAKVYVPSGAPRSA